MERNSESDQCFWPFCLLPANSTQSLCINLDNYLLEAIIYWGKSMDQNLAERGTLFPPPPPQPPLQNCCRSKAPRRPQTERSPYQCCLMQMRRNWSKCSSAIKALATRSTLMSSERRNARSLRLAFSKERVPLSHIFLIRGGHSGLRLSCRKVHHVLTFLLQFDGAGTKKSSRFRERDGGKPLQMLCLPLASFTRPSSCLIQMPSQKAINSPGVLDHAHQPGTEDIFQVQSAARQGEEFDGIVGPIWTQFRVQIKFPQAGKTSCYMQALI